MSIKLLSAAWDLDIGSTEKMVLMSLCDFANESGVCWPSVATICRKTSKSERTVQTALKWLRDNGFYEINGYHKQTPLYELNPRKICTPAELAPPQKLHDTPAKSAPKPLGTPIVDKAKALPTPRAKPAKPKFQLPDWVPVDAWEGFEEMRRLKGKQMTDRARDGIIDELQKLRGPPGAILDQSTRNNWLDVYELKDKTNGKFSDKHDGMGVTERAAHRALSEITGGDASFTGGGSEIPRTDPTGSNRIIDAVPNAVRSIGNAGSR